MPEGKAAFVGVAGRTLTELCGDLAMREPEAVDGLAMLALELEEALERLCWWLGPGGNVLRIDETDELVLFRPLSPAEDRRYEECGVRVWGLRLCRFRVMEPLLSLDAVVLMRGLAGNV